MKKDNCTAMLVGKDATLDGSTMIARDEDGYGGINEKLFVVNKARHYDCLLYTSLFQILYFNKLVIIHKFIHHYILLLLQNFFINFKLNISKSQIKSAKKFVISLISLKNN